VELLAIGATPARSATSRAGYGRRGDANLAATLARFTRIDQVRASSTAVRAVYKLMRNIRHLGHL
jgi:hypothetical protein